MGWTITTELSGVFCAGIMLVTPQEIAGMGRFEAFLVNGQNAERASSQRARCRVRLVPLEILCP